MLAMHEGRKQESCLGIADDLGCSLKLHRELSTADFAQHKPAVLVRH